MSQRSQTLAAHAKQFLENQPEHDAASLSRNHLLDEGFARLTSDIRTEFEKQIDELNHEPDCGNVLICKFGDGKPGVYHVSRPELFLSVKFDAPLRLITLECEHPIKFKRFIGVQLFRNETGWYYAWGKTKSELVSCDDQVDWLVADALYALFGVSRA